jgi:DNA-binding CsgD family transcriptional regulator
MRHAGPIDVLEAVYCAGSSRAAWLRRVLESAAPLLHPGTHPSGYFFDFSGATATPVQGVQVLGGGATVVEGLAAFHNRGPKVSYALVRATLVSTGSEMARTAGLAAEFEQFQRYFAKLGLRVADTLGVVGADPSRRGVAVSCLYDREVMVTRAARRRWMRVAVHLAAGSRLLSAFDVAPPGKASRPDAVLGPDGRVEHAEGEAREAVALESLRTRAVAIDRARGRLRRSDPDAALDAWHGLVAGRWSLVDRFESDGRRYVVAHRNEPETAGVLSLTARERQVVGYRMAGHSSKLTAYALGVSPAAVSAALKSSVEKLGVGTVARMLHELGGLAKSGPPASGG